MQFSVIAISTIPDTGSARSMHDLDDLDEESIGKVLYHRRKQQTGGSDDLRFDQLGIANLTVIRHSADYVQIDNHRADRLAEADILASYYEAVLRFNHFVTWGGERHVLPVLHTRSLLHKVAMPEYWLGMRNRNLVHLDMEKWNRPVPGDAPTLDETARLLGYPGMLGHTGGAVWPAWLEGDHAGAQIHGELSAINTYLVALNVLSLTGEITEPDCMRAQSQVYEMMATVDAPHFVRFLDAWEHDA